MNNEPVAWMWSEDGCNLAVCLEQDKQIGKQEFQDYDIPLYLHPAEPKELTVPENSQDWKGMDGATAFWLIERHSNHWDDAKLMMEEWLKANTHPAKTLTDEEIDSIWAEMSEQCDEEFIDMKQFARAILRKTQEK